VLLSELQESGLNIAQALIDRILCRHQATSHELGNLALDPRAQHFLHVIRDFRDRRGPYLIRPLARLEQDVSHP